MKSRLVFKDKNSSNTSYQWNKYITNRGRHFIFDKYTINSQDVYTWKKYGKIDATEYTYVWEKSTPTTTVGYPAFNKTYRTSTTNQSWTYKWNRREAWPQGTTLYSWDYYSPQWYWDEYDTKEEPIYKYDTYKLTGESVTIPTVVGWYYPQTVSSTGSANVFPWDDGTHNRNLENQCLKIGEYTLTGYATLADWCNAKAKTPTHTYGTNGSVAEDGSVTVDPVSYTRKFSFSRNYQTYSARISIESSTEDFFGPGWELLNHGWFDCYRANGNFNVDPDCFNIRLTRADDAYGSITDFGDELPITKIFSAMRTPGNTPTGETWIRCRVLEKGQNASGQTTLKVAMWIYSTVDEREWQKSEPQATSIIGYSTVPTVRIGSRTSYAANTYTNNTPFTTETGQTHWVYWSSIDYYEQQGTYTSNTENAYTTTNLEMTLDQAMRARTLIGPKQIELLFTPRDKETAIATTETIDDPEAWPIDGYAYYTDNKYYHFTFVEKAPTDPRMPTVPYYYSSTTDTIYKYLISPEEIWHNIYVYIGNSQQHTAAQGPSGTFTIKLYKSPEDLYNDSEDYMSFSMDYSGSGYVHLKDYYDAGYRWFYTPTGYFLPNITPDNPVGFVGYLHSNSYFARVRYSYSTSYRTYIQADNLDWVAASSDSIRNTAPQSWSGFPVTAAWSGWHFYIDHSNVKANIKMDVANGYAGIQPLGNDYLFYLDTKGATTTVYGPGDDTTIVTSSDGSKYPISGVQDGYFYKLIDTIEAGEVSRGEYIEDIIGYNSEAYPTDGVEGDYWYVYQDMETQYSAGALIERVTTPTDAYPHGGTDGKYYYEYIGDSDNNYPGNLVEEVFSNNRNAYPTNGEAADGYYYIYIGLMPSVLYTITSTEIKGGVEYSININPDPNLEFGTAAAASIQVEILDDEVEAQKYLGQTCDYYTQQGDDPTWRKIGEFTITDVNHSTSISSKLTGYDNMTKLDMDVEEWLYNLQYPMTLGNFFASLCRQCGVSYVTNRFTNSDYMVYENVAANGITGRQVLVYICQVAGGFARCNAAGQIEIASYTPTQVALDSTKYQKATLAIYDTTQLHKLVIKGSEDDIGVTIGSGDGVYTVVSNPLLFTDSADQLHTVGQNLLKIIEPITYSPATIQLQQDYSIDAGDIIKVDGRSVYVMEKNIKANGVELKCFGEKDRITVTSQVNTELIALRGKTNELSRDLDSTKSTLTDNTKQLQSQIEQTASSLTATINSQGQTITKMQADLDGISLTYNSSNGTASLRIGDITVSNLVDNTYVSKAIAGIEMTGYVKFNDLSRSGSTTINGNNITTGTISADRLNLTGAITWGDLSSDAKSKIIEYAEDVAQQAVGIPSYIHSTYIDQTNIYSPNIYGAKITAGSSSDGYIQMSSTGMNFHSGSAGKSICSIGYYSGNWNYPMIVLGGGVDSVGTDRGMIKKYANGIWIGDSDGINSSSVGQGDGIFIRFTDHTIWAYKNGSAKQLA